MRSETFDVERTVAYAHSHDLAQRALPFALLGVLFGLFVITPLGTAAPRPKDLWLGAIIIAISIGFIGVIIYRRSQANTAGIVLSPRGILFLELSDKNIPWNEIREIGSKRITRSRDFLGVKVTKLVVSERFLATLVGDKGCDSSVAVHRNPSEIYISYFQPPPFEEFQEAVRRRWHAFSVHAKGLPPLPPPQITHLSDAESRAGTQTPIRAASTTVQRASPFEGIRGFAVILRGSSPAQLLLVVLTLAGIGALLSNKMRLWSTSAQDQSQTKAAEWRALQKKMDDEDKEREAARRLFDERMNRAFRCMDRHLIQTPECQKRD